MKRTPLPPRYLAILDLLSEHKMATTGHIRRLFYSANTPDSARTQVNRNLGRLVELGQLRRIPRPLGGYNSGSGEYIYQLPRYSAKRADDHALDILELRVRLVEAEREGLLVLNAFYPEKHKRIQRFTAKPDAYVDFTVREMRREVFLEVDEGSEHDDRLKRKMRGYANLYEHWNKAKDGPTMPLVVWAWQEEKGRRYIEEARRHAAYPSHHMLVPFDEVVERFTS